MDEHSRTLSERGAIPVNFNLTLHILYYCQSLPVLLPAIVPAAAAVSRGVDLSAAGIFQQSVLQPIA